MQTSVSRRKVVVVVLGCILFVLLAAFTALSAFKLNFLTPATTGEIVVFSGLSVVVFLLFLAVLVLLVRNVLKLSADQRSSVMGRACAPACSPEPCSSRSSRSSSCSSSATT